MEIFVAKLSPVTSEVNLRQAFSEFGEVIQCKIVMDRDTGKSKCYGFVKMADQSEANSAIDGLNGSRLDGNQIVVKKSDPKPQEPRRQNWR